jgi:hypothetical protein
MDRRGDWQTHRYEYSFVRFSFVKIDHEFEVKRGTHRQADQVPSVARRGLESREYDRMELSR